MNIIQWCDENITFLKSNGISFIGGLAQVPQSAVYVNQNVPYTIVTFGHRNDIPADRKKDSLISFFSPDDGLFPRLERIEDDIQSLKEYGGMCGFDMSPSIGMIRPRQRMSLLISSIYNCRCALAGIKIVPNARTGDLGTMQLVSDSIPCCSVIATGELGCRQAVLRGYGLYQLAHIIHEHKTEKVLVYGGFSVADAKRCAAGINPRFIVYPDRRSRMRNHAMPYQLIFNGYCYVKASFEWNDNWGGVA